MNSSPVLSKNRTSWKKPPVWYASPEVFEELKSIASDNGLSLTEEGIPEVYRIVLSPWLGHVRDSALFLSRDFRNLNGPNKLGSRQLPLVLDDFTAGALDQVITEMWKLGVRGYNTGQKAHIQAAVYHSLGMRK